MRVLDKIEFKFQMSTVLKNISPFLKIREALAVTTSYLKIGHMKKQRVEMNSMLNIQKSPLVFNNKL
jgi:hypothetical protein